MTRFLRSHPLLAASVSLVLLVLGTWLVFSPDTNDISDAAMTMTFVGFLSFCLGAVGILILVVRPVVFSKLRVGSWETIRVQGKRHFISRFLLFASPILVGVLMVLIWNVKSNSDLVRGIIVMIVFTGTVVLAALEFWKHFERQHQTELRTSHQSDEVKN